MAADAKAAFERGVAREAAGGGAVDVAAEGAVNVATTVAVNIAANLAADVVAQLPWIGATPRVRDRVVMGAAAASLQSTLTSPWSPSLSREASARLARDLGLGLGSGRGRGNSNGVDLRRGENFPLSLETADAPRRIPRLRAQTSARVALASLTIFASLATSLLHEPATRGSLPAFVRSGGARESLQSRGGAPRGAGAMNRKQVLAAVIGVGAVTTGAAAQDAVQWRVEDGGNGHWYAVDGLTPLGLNWADAELSAVARGAHLASITSASENTFVLNFATNAAASFHTFWIGGYRNGSNGTPPGFTWTAGEPWSVANWGPGGEPVDTWGCWGPNPNNCG
ncbi:MAG: hypothetical protein RL591_75, partial [Planctomycetota bacterium]